MLLVSVRDFGTWSFLIKEQLYYKEAGIKKKASVAVPLKSPCACRLSCSPPLSQVITWRWGLSQGSTLHAESLAMRSKALPVLRQVLGWGLTQGTQHRGLCRWPGEELPGALALQGPLRVALLACGPQQAATRIAETTCELVVGPRQARHAIAVAQAGPRAPADRVEVTAKRLQARRDIRPPPHGVERAASLSSDVCSTHGWRGRRFSAVGQVVEPGGALLSLLGGLSTGRQSRLEALIPLGAARLIALGQ